MDLIRITPDRERARSLLETVDVRLDSIGLMKKSSLKKFSSKIIEEYYEVLLELITAVMCSDGYKVSTESAGTHIAAIDYMSKYKEIGPMGLRLIDELRKKRIGIKYYGRHVTTEYLERSEKDILAIIKTMKSILKPML